MFRTHPWAHLAAAAALTPTVVALGPHLAGADEPELVEVCTTDALSPEEIEEGVVSEVTCTWEEESGGSGGSMAMSVSDLLAIHHDGHSGIGPKLNVLGLVCVGGVSFGIGDPWNNRINSTTHRLCGTIKHYVNADYSGAVQVSEGGWGKLTEMGAGFGNNISSISYAL